jgi:hypothetical protein
MLGSMLRNVLIIAIIGAVPMVKMPINFIDTTHRNYGHNG